MLDSVSLVASKLVSCFQANAEWINVLANVGWINVLANVSFLISKLCELSRALQLML